jgi:N6-adenosine-specific RNA methylase IME4
MNELTPLYDTARRSLAEAKTLNEVKSIRDKALAMQTYARMAKDKTLEADAAEMRLLAERRVGEMIEAQKKTVGLNTGSRGRRVSEKPTLADSGIDKNLANKARTLAAMSDKQFEGVVDKTRKAVNKASKTAVANETKGQRRSDKMASLADKAMVMPTEHYVVAVIDPAWREEPWSRETGLNKAPDNHYPTQTPAEIAANKPPLTKDGIVYMWSTTSMMRVSQTILEDWGLEYHSHMMWVKERKGKQMGTGRWSRVDHEIVLIYTQGKPPAPSDSDKISSVLYGPVRRHSEKPDEFYDMILRNYPPPVPLLEMYGRKKRAGFTVLGNEIEENEDD